MLVLSRKLNEQIRIGGRVTVTVVHVKGNTVRIGIEAPKEIRVVRAELPPLARESAPARRILPLESKISRLAEADGEACRGQNADRRQQVNGVGRHPDRWSITSMRDRTIDGRAQSERGCRGLSVDRPVAH